MAPDGWCPFWALQVLAVWPSSWSTCRSMSSTAGSWWPPARSCRPGPHRRRAPRLYPGVRPAAPRHPGRGAWWSSPWPPVVPACGPTSRASSSSRWSPSAAAVATLTVHRPGPGPTVAGRGAAARRRRPGRGHRRPPPPPATPPPPSPTGTDSAARHGRGGRPAVAAAAAGPGRRRAPPGGGGPGQARDPGRRAAGRAAATRPRKGTPRLTEVDRGVDGRAVTFRPHQQGGPMTETGACWPSPSGCGPAGRRPWTPTPSGPGAAGRGGRRGGLRPVVRQRRRRRTAEGLVLVDVGSPFLSGQVHRTLRAWSAEPPPHRRLLPRPHRPRLRGPPVRGRRRGPAAGRRPPVVAHEAVAARFDRYVRTAGYNAVVNRRQFGIDDLEWPTHYRYPDLTFRDRLDLDVGGVRAELHHARGETDDHAWTWFPDTAGAVHRRPVHLGVAQRRQPPEGPALPPRVGRGAAAPCSRSSTAPGGGPEVLLPGHGYPDHGGRPRSAGPSPRPPSCSSRWWPRPSSS